MRPAGGRGVEPRMGLGRALRSEALRLRRSPRVALPAAGGRAARARRNSASSAQPRASMPPCPSA